VLTVRGAAGRESRRAPLSDECNLRYQVVQSARYAKPIQRRLRVGAAADEQGGPILSSRMSITVFTTFWLIVLARITDVSLDTIRMVSVIQGRRMFAAVLGFFQATVFICAVAKVLLNVDQPVYAVAYGFGFAAGTYLGMVIEQRLAFGKQLVFLLTAKGPELAKVLRAGGYRVAEIKGNVPEGDRTILCVEIQRRDAQKLTVLASAIDERCAFIVHDIRTADLAMAAASKGNKRNRSWLFALEGLASVKRSAS